MTYVSRTGMSLLCRVPPEHGKILKLWAEEGRLFADTEAGCCEIVMHLDGTHSVVLR